MASPEAIMAIHTYSEHQRPEVDLNDYVLVNGDVVREYRTNAALTLRQFADRIGTGPGFLAQIEAGRTSVHPDIFHHIIQATGLTREQLTAPKAVKSTAGFKATHQITLEKMSNGNWMAHARVGG